MVIFMLQLIKQLNPTIDIHTVHDPIFQKYGCVVERYDFSELLSYIMQTPMPAAGNAYVPDMITTHQFDIFNKLQDQLFGEMPIQLGYCNGYNNMLDALEFHKGNEVDVAATDCILLLSSIIDMENGRLQSSKITAFYVNAGEAVELYGTTLHFAPCMVNPSGYKTAVVLPKGTNQPLSRKYPEDPLLRMSNKWLIAHPDCKRFADSGAYLGIDGSNICVKC